jgi:hypothetical protein
MENLLMKLAVEDENVWRTAPDCLRKNLLHENQKGIR